MYSHLYKYPRTPHLQGSRLQPGDEGLKAISFEELRGRHFVVEEKMDGANAGISIGPDGQLMLQSRGHYLTGGLREKHFDRFKSWAYGHAPELVQLLGHRFILYGEWLFAKHTVFYNRLPHYFLEFDILDREKGEFLSTQRRRALLKDFSFVKSVAVIKEGPLKSLDELVGMLGPSACIAGDHCTELRLHAESLGLRSQQVLDETDPSCLMEGLYIKWEENGQVLGRYKYVRSSFLQAVAQAEGHWLNRPIVPNLLEAKA